jgi:FMN phosphatase YigB (HAD superfamily)
VPGFSDAERRIMSTTGPRGGFVGIGRSCVSRARRLAAPCSGWPGRVRYDAIFLDVDGGTLPWVYPDVERHVGGLSPYADNGGLTAEWASGPAWGSLRRHIRENIEHRTEKPPARFRRRDAERTTAGLGIEVPTGGLTGVAERRISPHPDAGPVPEGLNGLGVPVSVVCNRDIGLAKVLDGLGWTRFFDGIVASAVLVLEKPRRKIYDEAMRLTGVPADRAVVVGNDPVSRVRGASEAGVGAECVDRTGAKAPEAAFVIPNLSELPGIVRG